MLTILGCGNLNRTDDGVGPVVARRLAERLHRHPVPGVQVFDAGTGGMDVMFRARGSDSLLVIDACRSDSEPGAIFEVPGDELADVHEPVFSLHDFRWNHALYAGRRIFGDDFPSEVSVWLVEAASIDLGLELTEPVARAADEVYERMLSFAADYAARRHQGAAPVRIGIRRGMLRVPAAVYRQFFSGREAALFLIREGRLHVVPVDPVSGGVLLKQRTAAGDRAADAGEFLRAHGWDDLGHYECPATWNGELGALVIEPPAAP